MDPEKFSSSCACVGFFFGKFSKWDSQTKGKNHFFRKSKLGKYQARNDGSQKKVNKPGGARKVSSQNELEGGDFHCGFAPLSSHLVK